MFKAVINADVFKDAIEAVSTLVDEAKFKLTKEGISVRAVDPANVAMVAFDLNAKAFETFEASDSEIGVDLIRLMDILGMTSKDDKIELNLNEETRKLEIRTGAWHTPYRCSTRPRSGRNQRYRTWSCPQRSY